MRNPLTAVAALYAGGLVLATCFPVGLTWLFTTCLILGILALAISSVRGLILLLLVPLFAWTNLAARQAILSPRDLRLIVGEETEYVTVRGWLLETPVLREYRRGTRLSYRSMAEIQVEAVQRKTEWQPGFGRVIASTPGILDPHFWAGQRLEVTGVLQMPRGPSAPGQFDYRAYLQCRGIFHQLRAESTNDWVRLANADALLSPPFCDRFYRWAQQTLSKGMPSEDEPLRLLWAMTLGWKTALTQEVAEPFMQSGTLHVFAISGMHIALIAGILVSLLRVLRVSRRVSGLVVIPLLWFYTAATGWQASAVRSTVMMTIVIGGWALERPAHLVNSLAAAGLIILVWDPAQLFQASFQLSFFVVLGIALLVPPLEQVRERLFRPDPLLPPELRPRWQRWLDLPVRWVTTSFATSLAAWIGSAPLIAYYFYMITPGSLLANLLIVPLSGLALMSSLGSLVCGTWCSTLTELFNHSAWVWMLAMIRLSEWFALLPGAFFYIRQPSLPAIGFYYLLLSGLLSGIFFLPRWRLMAGLAAGLLMGAGILHWQTERGTVCLTVLPMVSASTFIDSSGSGHDLLVDCADAAGCQALLKPFLRSQGVNRLPRVLLTHCDLRHIGGLNLISGHFGTRQILTSSGRVRSPAYRALVAELEQTPNRWRQLARGDRVDCWNVLHPAREDKFAQGSNSSLVLRGQVHGTTVLLLSDLGRLGQRTLLDREPNLKCDILIAGVSNDGLSEGLLRAANPRLLVIGSSDFPASARGNRQFRDRLAALKIPVIYTSDSGAAVVAIRAGGWTVSTMNGNSAGNTDPEFRNPGETGFDDNQPDMAEVEN